MSTNACAAKSFVYVWEGPVRITHWVNFFCIIILSFTGYYIHNPFLSAPPSTTTFIMGNVRYIHYLTGVIFAMSLLIRLFWLFVGNYYSSFNSFLNPLNKNDRSTFWAYIRYYTFLGRKVPHTLGHNPLALLAYIVLFTLFILQVFAGFALWAQADPNSFMYSVTGWIFPLISNQWIRFFHYLVMFLIGGFFINHIYSAVLFDFKTQSGEISSIFSGWKPKRND
ncbi:Ni/Fe-hydrogenase, b-type cytochrome subunit [Flexistipes sinusarabici DSM 4947]|uniref:Ni/Fe-hydrogenase, b-type cytochrome subunit n=1 Tax=Flexistipes sinusarabici (strain ATCC 49648 / DSM 4947 / MAS 10) TaxID=717231 RepID=F8E3R0_FLESM|nr:Ni/Fe-hydrogenase, b-type cytochrome subunit [Flexistipes sinusarabici]AEI14333.1 Ni/Fe-hydrogenase, b-type cytochrome subunit [Flexistipes sinusarabici DSM 4947]